MIQNINPYDSAQFKKQFESTDICRSVSKDFENLWWNQQPIIVDSFTPRGQLNNLSFGFSMIPFYYLLPLLEKTPRTIHDLGCGSNIFKKYIPNIIGIDRSNYQDSNPDIEDQITPKFINDQQN